ncbi:MAG: hypothetical protein IT518_09835 [Burkholderiales bacterium]|nr:hypothetical protein [Burkholderiales bacterium]
MMVDRENVFSWDQAITASAASTNVFDLGPSSYDRGPGEGKVIAITLPAAFTLLTSLEFTLQTDDDDQFGSARDLTKLSVEIARLTKGASFTLPVPHEAVERYLRMYYTVTGTNPGAGKVRAWLAPADHIDQNNDFRAA